MCVTTESKVHVRPSFILQFALSKCILTPNQQKYNNYVPTQN